MPAATSYSPDDKKIRQQADAEFKSRRGLVEHNKKYYRGDHKRPLVDEKDNIVLNLAREALDATISFLVPSMPIIETGDPGINQWLADQWQAAGGATLLLNLAKNGGFSGQCFARVTQPDGMNTAVFPLNPANIIVWWDADDLTQVLWYELRWNVGKRHYRQDIIYNVDSWVIRDFEQISGRWHMVPDGETVWPFTLAPIVDWQHLEEPNQYYGSHEFQHLGLNDHVNKVASDISRILRFHAFPRTVAIGVEKTDIQESGIDDLWTIPNPDAKVQNLEMESDLTASMEFLKLLMAHYDAESRVVKVSGTLDSFKSVTNLGIRTAFMPMLSKNETLRRMYDVGIRGISTRLLMVNGEPLPEQELSIIWPEPLPIDRREQVANVQAELNLAIISPQTAARDLGRNYDAERELIADSFEFDGDIFAPPPTP